uniref:Uncharacterized protein n=1 Tax=Glossina austeni TaxID=7395 RepID=A0A1A9VRP6_GLOAU
MQSNPTFGIHCSITVRAAKGECLPWDMTCIFGHHANGWMIDNELAVSTHKLTQFQFQLVSALLSSVSFVLLKRTEYNPLDGISKKIVFVSKLKTIPSLKRYNCSSHFILFTILSLSFGSKMPSPPSSRLLCLKCLCWQRNNSSKASCSATPAVAAAIYLLPSLLFIFGTKNLKKIK